jgi:predicted RNA-binding protein YlxR (DUF448 family)
VKALRTGAAPRRTCVGCGRRDVQRDLSRLQVCRDGALRVAVRTGPGRSAYIHPQPACIDALVKSRLLKRSLRRDVDAGRRSTAAAELRARIALARPGVRS